MTTTTVPEQAPHGSVEYYAARLRDSSWLVRASRILGFIDSIVISDEPATAMGRLKNLLAAEKIVAAEDDAPQYERELDPEQTGASIPAYVEGHAERGRGTTEWS